MGVLLGQLPPAELARLKAELAETLIAHFCYPRFFDYRNSSLRSRPVDRSKRQEVWLYLSSFDFTAWNRVDLMSTDFQHYVERLFIHFVQRNRSFFGDQGRKRMSDIRMLIGTSAASVVQGLRSHLMGQHQQNPPFGSPRPVTSWSTVMNTEKSEATWDHISASTMILQQQLQEVRGEIKTAAQQSEARPGVVPARRPSRSQAANGKAAHGAEQYRVSNSPTMPMSKTPQQTNGRGSTSPSAPKNTSPLNPAWQTAAPVAPARAEPLPSIPEPPIFSVAPAAVPIISPNVSVPPAPVPETVPAITPSTPVQARGLPQTVPAALSATQRDSATILVSEEDMAIFEQLRHQLVVWLRIEAVRSGMEISNLSPSQLLELLRQNNNGDETRLQVVSTLLNLSNQVIKNGQASLFDYKQALMFHLMHTRR
jgi:hypothetical protein